MKFTKNIKFTWWQVGIFKLSTISFGALAGLYFRDTLIGYVNILWILMIISGLYIGYIWFKQK
jgi:hypothetical protein